MQSYNKKTRKKFQAAAPRLKLEYKKNTGWINIIVALATTCYYVENFQRKCNHSNMHIFTCVKNKSLHYIGHIMVRMGLRCAGIYKIFPKGNCTFLVFLYSQCKKHDFEFSLRHNVYIFYR